MPTIPIMPASTTVQAGAAATSFIASMAGPIEMIVGLFLGLLIVEILFVYLGNRELGPVPEYDDTGPEW